jgi:hypothetical protein
MNSSKVLSSLLCGVVSKINKFQNYKISWKLVHRLEFMWTQTNTLLRHSLKSEVYKGRKWKY